MSEFSVYPLKLYFKNTVNLILSVGSVLVNFGIWFWILWNIRPQQDLIFLHYNILFGVDLIGEWWKILFLPLSGLIIFLANYILGWILFGKDKLISYLLNFISLFSQIFLAIAGYLLVLLNI